MGGKFINTSFNSKVDSLIEGRKKRINNPYYIFQDQKPTPTTYFNLNIHKSTLDESLKYNYSDLGCDAFKFNRINNFYIYGIDKISLNFQFDEEKGLVADEVEGEALILPNTITPRPNDYFMINYIDHNILFKVLSATPDTIENDANFWKIEYKLDKIDSKTILDQVVEDYTMVVNNVGSDFKTIIRNNDYDLITKLDNLNITLREYYKSLFYSDRVQTFILCKDGFNFYDPSLIEFIMRNDIINYDRKYLYITQQIHLSNTFPIDYDNTFFRMFETKNKNKKYRICAQSRLIEDILSILTSRKEDYQEIYYFTETNPYKYILDCFPEDLYKAIKNNQELEKTDYRNIIAKYFLNKSINSMDIDNLLDVEYQPTIEFFYLLPLVIFCIDSMIRELMTKIPKENV